MNLTSEQQHIVDTIKLPTTDFIAVSAVSGAGKTSLLTAIAKEVKPKTGLYLAYNKSIAEESKGRFPKAVDCRTTHSLAYQYTVKTKDKHAPIKVGHFSYRDIIDRNLDYYEKLAVMNLMKDFCLSAYEHFDIFVNKECNGVDLKHTNAAKKYLGLMQQGKINSTHDFYLKYFHLLLAHDQLDLKEVDILMLDEAGDLNPVTLEIFKLYPAKKKIMVGDENQNIYTFNGTINGFYAMKNEGIHLPMTKSFRVSKIIAEAVEKFCRKYFNPTMTFEGTDAIDSTISTKAIITRTNSGLIKEMIKCDDVKEKYNLVRDPKEIFKLPLILMSLKPNHFVSDPAYKHLQDDTDEYYKDLALHKIYKSLFSYLISKHPADQELNNAVSVITQYTPKVVWDTYHSAKSHLGTKHSLTLCTAHSSKGLEFDAVTVADDLNKAVFKAIGADDTTTSEADRLAELRLYYVAVTRAKKYLENAKAL